MPPDSTPIGGSSELARTPKSAVVDRDDATAVDAARDRADAESHRATPAETESPDAGTREPRVENSRALNRRAQTRLPPTLHRLAPDA
jgi:hypothetical protein